MASPDERKIVEKLAAHVSRIPTLELPSIPILLKQNPKYRAAWQELERQLDYWRKTLGLAAGGAAVVTGGAAPTTIISGGAVQPAASEEPNLKALYLFDWVMQ